MRLAENWRFCGINFCSGLKMEVKIIFCRLPHPSGSPYSRVQNRRGGRLSWFSKCWPLSRHESLTIWKPGVLAHWCISAQWNFVWPDAIWIHIYNLNFIFRRLNCCPQCCSFLLLRNSWTCVYGKNKMTWFVDITLWLSLRLPLRLGVGVGVRVRRRVGIRFLLLTCRFCLRAWLVRFFNRFFLRETLGGAVTVDVGWHWGEGVAVNAQK